ncbi:hypothetical protein T492DRAFT_1120976 [Pavlovales sp. CCMP2436]|nr:hypothetical protein T492DRAFT_1120976 [Pavlovales sp. CCMP2436]
MAAPFPGLGLIGGWLLATLATALLGIVVARLLGIGLLGGAAPPGGPAGDADELRSKRLRRFEAAQNPARTASPSRAPPVEQLAGCGPSPTLPVQPLATPTHALTPQPTVSKAETLVAAAEQPAGGRPTPALPAQPLAPPAPTPAPTPMVVEIDALAAAAYDVFLVRRGATAPTGQPGTAAAAGWLAEAVLELPTGALSLAEPDVAVDACARALVAQLATTAAAGDAERVLCAFLAGAFGRLSAHTIARRSTVRDTFSALARAKRVLATRWWAAMIELAKALPLWATHPLLSALLPRSVLSLPAGLLTLAAEETAAEPLCTLLFPALSSLAKKVRETDLRDSAGTQLLFAASQRLQKARDKPLEMGVDEAAEAVLALEWNSILGAFLRPSALSGTCPAVGMEAFPDMLSMSTRPAENAQQHLRVCLSALTAQLASACKNLARGEGGRDTVFGFVGAVLQVSEEREKAQKIGGEGVGALLLGNVFGCFGAVLRASEEQKKGQVLFKK